ncbi:MAG: DegT/DnrJ/EryC1/StrS family aminotransferase [Bacteroidales bacterium]|nr:DegT/DnrJ/EryC1/StrS family aminotransferase [Bacteroidales bacterium]
MIPISKPAFNGNEKRYVSDALDSGWISSIGAYVDQFERSFADYFGLRHAVATHNGTIALHLALAASGITHEDQVIVPDLTFIATANCVRYCNAVPVLTDIELDDWNIAPLAIEKAITPETKAIIPVHLYGNPARMNEIIDIAKRHHLIIIEDCAESIGATYNGKKTGTFGDISCFSFFGNKVITTGEGGMCLTNNDELAEKMRVLRDHGMSRSKKYWYDHLGYNYRMTNIQAAIGLAQLEQIDFLLKIRDQIYQAYIDRLKHRPEFIVQETHGQRNINWVFTLRMEGLDESRRDQVREILKEKKIDTRPVFYPIHKMSFYQSNQYLPFDCPNTNVISAEGISLPTFTDLTLEEIQYIATNLIDAYDSVKK